MTEQKHTQTPVNNYEALVEALREAEAVMAKNIYPKPDCAEHHPWAVLRRVRHALAIAERAE